jgi:uncharacterized membrane protein YhaH (DUF805 family)
MMLFPHRIGRLAYGLRYVVLLMLIVLGNVALNVAAASGSAGMKIALYLAASGIMIFALVALFRSVLIPRLRDIGLHGVWSLLVFVPLVNIAFVVVLLLIRADAFAPKVQAG